MWAAEKTRRGRQAGAESRRCRAVLSCKRRGSSATPPDRWAPLDPRLPRPRSWHRACTLRAVRKNCTTKNGGFFQAGMVWHRAVRTGKSVPWRRRAFYPPCAVQKNPLKVRIWKWFKFTTRCFALKKKKNTHTLKDVYMRCKFDIFSNCQFIWQNLLFAHLLTGSDNVPFVPWTGSSWA
jgi:hypothetical protein